MHGTHEPFFTMNNTVECCYEGRHDPHILHDKIYTLMCHAR